MRNICLKVSSMRPRFKKPTNPAKSEPQSPHFVFPIQVAGVRPKQSRGLIEGGCPGVSPTANSKPTPRSPHNSNLTRLDHDVSEKVSTFSCRAQGLSFFLIGRWERLGRVQPRHPQLLPPKPVDPSVSKGCQQLITLQNDMRLGLP